MYVYTPHHCSKVAIFHPSTGIALSKHWEYRNTNGDCMPMAMMINSGMWGYPVFTQTLTDIRHERNVMMELTEPTCSSGIALHQGPNLRPTSKVYKTLRIQTFHVGLSENRLPPPPKKKQWFVDIPHLQTNPLGEVCRSIMNPQKSGYSFIGYNRVMDNCPFMDDFASKTLI